MSAYSFSEFLIEVNKGKVAGHSLVHKFGFSDKITTGHFDIWNDPTAGGANLVFSTVATQYDVYSSNVNDTRLGTGARTVVLEILDADWNTDFITVELDGTTPVTTALAPGIRLQRAYLGLVGTYGGSNLGNIDIEITSGGAKTGNRQGYIELGEGQTQKSQYTIPANHTAYILRSALTIEANKVFSTDLHIRAGADIVSGDMIPMLVKHRWNGLIAPVVDEFKANHILQEKSDVWFSATGTSSGGVIEVDYDILLVHNGYLPTTPL